MPREKQFLHYLARLASDQNLTVSASQLHNWSQQEIERMEAKRILHRAGFGDEVLCSHCHQNCLIAPKIVDIEGKKMGVFVCNDPDYGGRLEFERGAFQNWEINPAKLPKVKPSKKPSRPKADKKRATKKQLQERNQAVANMVAIFYAKHERSPTVDEVMKETGFTRNQVYHTDAYKERQIAKASSKPTQELTGASIHSSEQYSGRSHQHCRASRRSKTEQAHLDALIEDQQRDQNSQYSL